MTVVYLFFTFLAIFGLGVIGALANMASVFMRNEDIDIFSIMKTHFILGIMVVIGKVGMIITGVIWIVESS